MSGCGTSCCDPSGTGLNLSATHTITNVGGAAESYVNGTGPDPFELRTLESSDGSVSIAQLAQTLDFTVDAADLVSLANVGGFAEVWQDPSGPDPFNLRTIQSSDGTIDVTQNADDIDLTVDAADLVSLANVGGFAEVWQDPSGPDPFNLRTIQSSDGSVTVTQNANDIDLQVPVGDLVKVFQSDGVQTQSTTSTSFVIWRTTAAIPEILDGETWKINWCVAVCHPANVFTVNTQVRIEVETSAGVWAVLDSWQVAWAITITSGNSCPAHRTIQLVAQMDTPRFRFSVRMTAAQASATFVELPRVGGVIDTDP